MGFSWQEYWIGLPFPPPGDLLDSGIEPKSPASPALAGRFFTTREAHLILEEQGEIPTEERPREHTMRSVYKPGREGPQEEGPPQELSLPAP